ncbi:hypothetical protein UB51_01825 [Paenibacillus sp. IHBB 10380]|nr:hypothetical protein UB51_01825 [Paenibacillus sp. IHBB 10380]
MVIQRARFVTQMKYSRYVSLTVIGYYYHITPLFEYMFGPVAGGSFFFFFAAHKSTRYGVLKYTYICEEYHIFIDLLYIVYLMKYNGIKLEIGGMVCSHIL